MRKVKQGRAKGHLGKSLGTGVRVMSGSSREDGGMGVGGSYCFCSNANLEY